jgi:hypothetical protein
VEDLFVAFDRWGGASLPAHGTAPEAVATLLVLLGVDPVPDAPEPGGRALSFGRDLPLGWVSLKWFPVRLTQQPNGDEQR